MSKKKSETQNGSLANITVGLTGMPPGIIFQGKGVMAADAGEGNKRKKPRSPEEEARLRAHWVTVSGKEQLCIPWVMLYQAICTAAGSFKFRGRQTMATVVAATIACDTDRIPLGSDKFEVYSEYVRVPPRTGAMVSMGRPKIPEWKIKFNLIVDSEMYAAESLKEIIIHAGKLVGIGAWRPQLKGPYGRFSLTEFEIK